MAETDDRQPDPTPTDLDPAEAERLRAALANPISPIARACLIILLAVAALWVPAAILANYRAQALSYAGEPERRSVDAANRYRQAQEQVQTSRQLLHQVAVADVGLSEAELAAKLAALPEPRTLDDILCGGELQARLADELKESAAYTAHFNGEFELPLTSLLTARQILHFPAYLAVNQQVQADMQTVCQGGRSFWSYYYDDIAFETDDPALTTLIFGAQDSRYWANQRYYIYSEASEVYESQYIRLTQIALRARMHRSRTGEWPQAMADLGLPATDPDDGLGGLYWGGWELPDGRFVIWLDDQKAQGGNAAANLLAMRPASEIQTLYAEGGGVAVCLWPDVLRTAPTEAPND